MSTKQIIKDDHFCLLTAKDIDAICRPLKMLGITSFDYVRTFDDGSKIPLCNNATWLCKYYNNGLYKAGNFENRPCVYKAGIALWSSISNQKVFAYGREYFDIDNGITVQKPSKDMKSCEFYFFGGSRRNVHLAEFLINNVELLEHFILYFKDRAAELINKALQNRIYLPKLQIQPDNYSDVIYNGISNIESVFRKFMQETKIKRFKLNSSVNDMYLTEKEYMISLFLVSGYSPSTIAGKIYRSTKTINRHIENIKLKLGCHKKEKLIKILADSGFGYHNKNITTTIFDFKNHVQHLN
jgi:LuxR family transcriptional regulator, quorum-sensing system regulator SolR